MYQKSCKFSMIFIDYNVHTKDPVISYFLFTDAFRIDMNTGDLYSLVSLDREQQAEYHLEIRVSDSSANALTSTAMLTVIVTDINDNAPQFGQDSYQTSILNQSPAGTIVLVPHVEDHDQGSNGQVTFSLGNADPISSYFGIDVNSGVIQVEQELSISNLIRDGILSPGDSEVSLTIAARDGGNPSQSSEAMLQIALLDPSDDTPHFLENSYMAAVMENAAPGE